ncbi:diguanylate cyclase [Pseudocolwellia sp. HL-MZ19]|uniref:diguanylate cyclase n=1 Tax=Pseudocolwellia sp. HL-MZ19 TaxID=3400846 RepID=UPI003CF3A48B
MINQSKHGFVTNKCTFKKFVFILLVLFNTSSYAAKESVESTHHAMDYKTTRTLINNIRSNKLDYLKNATELTIAFETSKVQNWGQLHYQAAALYSELLLREEKYDELYLHVNHYLDIELIQKQPDVFLSLLESKIKYLSRQDDGYPAQSLSKELEERLLIESSTKGKIIILRALAYYYTSIDALKSALKVSHVGLELAIEDEDFSSQGFFYRKIGDAYSVSNDKEKALEFAYKAVSASEKSGDGHFTSKAYWSLGNALLGRDKNDEALKYITKALAYFTSVNMHEGMAYAQYSVASILFSQGKYDEAIIGAKNNISLAKSAGVFDMQLASMILVSEIFAEQGQLQQANQMSDEVFTILDKFSRSLYKAEFLTTHYQLKRRLGYVDDAFTAIEQELFHYKKHFEATSASNIKTLQVKFEVKEKEDEIIKLAHENKINELKAKEENQQIIIWRLTTALALMLVLITLLLFYRQLGQRKKYHAMASTDYLTGCPNRRGIMLMAEEQLKEQDITIAIVDLDHFKKINDTYGHDIGDLFLVAFAKAAKKTLREDDKFGRYGGEEWLFILNTTSKSTTKGIYKRLAENFANYCIDVRAENPQVNWSITFSMGATICNSTNKETSLNDLIKHADNLLYRAKENGRDQLIIQSSSKA